jgi:hypothetical protein
MKDSTTDIYGEPSWQISSEMVEATVSVNGGMMAPVRFSLPDGRKVDPYYISPWWDEPRDAIEPAVLRPLRGDFFCLPFGGANDRGEEHHEPHGESSYAPWKLGTAAKGTLTCRMDYAAGGAIEKEIRCADGAPAVCTEHRVSGFDGSYPVGHHAILKGAAPGADASTPIWRIHTAPFDLGMTDPGNTSPADGGEYFATAPGGRFSSLSEVPTRWKTPEMTDCSFFPAREGFIDIIAWYRRPVADLAWTVAYNLEEGYAWYSIKDARILPATVMWMENRGRHGAPWSGRNSCVGIEETCSYFANGLVAPADGGAIGALGIPTAVALTPGSTFTVRTIQGVFPVGSVDDPVVELEESSGSATFVTRGGKRYDLGLDVSWVRGS